MNGWSLEIRLVRGTKMGQGGVVLGEWSFSPLRNIQFPHQTVGGILDFDICKRRRDGGNYDDHNYSRFNWLVSCGLTCAASSVFDLLSPPYPCGEHLDFLILSVITVISVVSIGLLVPYLPFFFLFFLNNLDSRWQICLDEDEEEED